MKTCLSLLSLVLCLYCAGAPKPERKIIIENGKFRYFTIDGGAQLATLVSGSPDQAFQLATRQLLPLGRRSTSPTQPLAFDIEKGSITAVNWIRYPRQHPFFSLKTIALADSSKWNTKNEQELMLSSCQQKDLTTFEPWKTVLQRNPVLKHSFFDLVKLDDGRLAVAIANQGELLLFFWDGKQWTTPLSMPFASENYFSLFTSAGKIMLISADGAVYLYGDKTGSFTLIKNIAAPLSHYTLVMDKDGHAVHLLPDTAFENGTKSLQEMIRKEGMLLIR